MGKDGKNVGESSTRKKKNVRESFSFLGQAIDVTDKRTVKTHLFYLLLIFIAATLLLVVVTTVVFRTFVDLFDIGIYLKHTLMLMQGQFPIDPEFPYPPLAFIPILIAFVPAIFFNSGEAFVFTFQFLMFACYCVTVVCVYFIGLKIYNEERTAFIAALLSATAFSALYFVITKFDAFPTMLLMLAVLFTTYKRTVEGYAAAMLGFFTKVFPILALPFFVFHNAKSTPLKQELISAAKVVIPIGIVLFLPLFLLNPSTFSIYIPIRSELGYYSNTLTFTLFSWLHNVFHLSVSLDMISAVMYAAMGLGLLILLYIAWRVPDKDPKLSIKLLLCAVVLVVVCAKVRSPQYIVWFTPLICILAADSFRKITSFYIFQVLAYAEFPLMFSAFYTALQYTDPALSQGWWITLMMFTLEYLALFICVWFVVNPREIAEKVKGAA